MRNDDFLDYLIDEGVALNTARCYERSIRGIWPNDPSGWVSKKLRGKPAGTACVIKSATRHFIAFNGGDPESHRLRGGRARSSTRIPSALTGGQLKAYYAEASKQAEPVRTILLLLPRCGMRISELCSVTTDDVMKRHGRYAFIVEGKRDIERKVYLSKEAEKVLGTYLKNLPRDSTYLFPSPKSSSSITPSRVRQVAQLIGDSIGVRTNPHTLRHTFASNLHSSGVSLPVLKEAMGHSSERTTMRYIHASDEDLIRAADLADRT